MSDPAIAEGLVPDCPTEGNISYLALTTSASSLQSLTAPPGGTAIYTFISDVQFWITFGNTAVTDPDETATSGNAVPWRVPADTAFHVKVRRGQADFKAKGSAGGVLRWYRS